MTQRCYECHTERIEAVKVAEDAQQDGYNAARSGDTKKGAEHYTHAAKILLEIPTLCRRHVPPLFCVGVRDDEFDGSWVWLPSMMGVYVGACDACLRVRPCVTLDSECLRTQWRPVLRRPQ